MKRLTEILFIVFSVVNLLFSSAVFVVALCALEFAFLSPVSVILIVTDIITTAVLLVCMAMFVGNRFIRTAFIISLVSAALVIAASITVFCFVSLS